MVNVIGVRFQNAGKLYFFDPGAYWPTAGDFVIVETTRGVELGEVVTGVQEIDDTQLTAPLKPVIRIASAQDVKHVDDNRRAEKEAYGVCQRKIAEHKLDMKLVKVEYTFDNSKILFYFTANGRVDFRSLVKDLAGVFKTRIELRQIGVRDEAKMLGGLGPCGRPVCCGTFLGDFQPVSIKMAKEQSLSLNPTKISGVCGRLMCCLKYEQDSYEQTRKRMPKVGKEVITPDGPGVVWDLNIIKETVRVRLQKGDSSEVRDFPMDEVQRPGVPAQQGAPRTAEPAAPKPAEVPAPQAAEAENAAPAPEQPAGEQSAVPAVPEQPRRMESRPRTGEEDRDARRDRMPRPVMRQNPTRPAGERTPQLGQPRAQKPQAQRPAPAQQSKPKTTNWQQAVADALRAAQGDDPADRVVEQLPETEHLIELEDHQDTYVFRDDSEEDDTI